jgi:membrane-associated phospholipid phosphatase
VIEGLAVGRNLALLSLAALIFFVLIAMDVNYEGTLARIDQLVHKWSLGWHTPLLDRIFYGITQLGNLMVMLFYTVALTLLMLWRKRKEGLLFYWSGMIGASLLFSVIKELIMRPRPSSYIGEFHQHGYSFPSGLVLYWLVFH